jgi:hypothetical protein
MPEFRMIRPEIDPAKLFRAVAIEELAQPPPWWPNDKQRVIVFQQDELASLRACLAALGGAA